ncbi:MAG: NADH-quinone oxidoreductase subunit M [Nitrospinae bacterium]|nr:NADH-quinone oxidoreductase subunit M [Nitrospinota bacterium]
MNIQVSEHAYLSLIIFLPLVAAVILCFVDKSEKEFIKSFGLGVTVLDLIIMLPLYTAYDSTVADLQFVEQYSWIETLNIQYFVGVDGISLFLIFLTDVLTILAISSAWTDIKHSGKEFMIAMMVLLTGMLGTFLAFDLVLFFIFWEAMLIPMYFMIGIWGGPKRVYSAIKFFLYTMSGSLLMLIAILFLVFLNVQQTGELTFNLLKLYDTSMSHTVQIWLFLAFFLAFAIKVPMFPFHTWLPDAHVEAPTAGSVILAGVLLKMGTYGFVRFSLPLFPDASYTFIPIIFALSVIGVIYAALVAMVQEDLKKLVAYSSISHLGFVTIGIFAMNAEGMEGSILHMVNHGIVSGALFMLVGMVYERRKTRMISELGGLTKVMPVYAVFFLIVTLASVGLPGMNGFVGEFLCILGVFKYEDAAGMFPITAILTATGVILSACYMLWMFQKVMFGKIINQANAILKDLNQREVASMVLVTVLIFWIGLYPNALIGKMETSVKNLLTQVEGKRTVVVAEMHNKK